MSDRERLAAESGRIKRIHVDQAVIRANIRDGTDLPCVTVQTSAGSLKGHAVEILGSSRVVSSFGKPLSCGARVWIETTAPVRLT